MPVFGNGEGHLGRGGTPPEIAPQADDALEADFARHGHDRKVFDVVHLGHVLHFVPVEMPPQTEKALFHILGVHLVEVLLNHAAVGRFGRAIDDPAAVVLTGLFHTLGVDPKERLLQGPAPANQSAGLGLFEKRFAVIRVGQADHGHGAFFHVFAEQIDGAVFTDHVGHIPPGDDHRTGSQGGDDTAGAAVAAQGGHQNN